MDNSAALRRLVNGYQVTQAIHVAATLGLADRLAAGARSAAELAGEVGADPEALYRLMRALATVEVLEELPERHFRLTGLGEALRSDAPGSLAGWASFVGRPYYWQAWSALLHSVRTGQNAFREVHGQSVWEYRAEHPEESAAFDRAMTTNSRLVADAVVAAYDFTPYRTVVDVGGGRGALIAAILRANPQLEGTLFDQPHVVSGAAPALEAAGVQGRCQVVGGDFFASVPGPADLYVMRDIIHDWADAEAIAILANCRAATREGSSVLLVERLLGGPNENPATAFSDLNMLVAPGGQERSEAEYQRLFAAAGYRHVRTIPTATGTFLLEAVSI